MKRTAGALVEYPSSDDDDSQEKSDQDIYVQLSKKRYVVGECMTMFSMPDLSRKLPPLSSSLVVSVPNDNPALHQGRIRTTPHIEGQFAAHVYVSLTLSRRSQFYKTIQDILSDAKASVPPLHDIWSAGAGLLELHISLSRPIFLRAHQREEFKRAVKNIAKSQKPFVCHLVSHLYLISLATSFQVSFTTLSELTNDEKTRTFLTMDIGAGFPEVGPRFFLKHFLFNCMQMRNLCKALSPALSSIRQQEYYTDPKFHASIAWALLHRARQTMAMPTKSPDPPSTPTDGAAFSLNIPDEGTTSSHEFPKISSFPQEMITALNKKYKLSSLKEGIFPVEALTLKIGKETFAWKFESLNRA